MFAILALLLASSLSPITPGNSARSPEWVQPGSGSRSPFINVRAAPYFAACNGSTDDAPTLTSAATAAVAAGQSLLINCKMRIGSAAGTITAPLIFAGAGALDLSPAAGSVTISGPVTAAQSQIFYTGSGSLTLSGSGVPCVTPMWFGADAAGVSDSSTAVTQAIIATPADNGTVCFPQGIFKFNVTIIKGGLVIRGAGSGNVNTGVGGTVFKPNNAANPTIQIGDGTTTAIRGVSITDAVVFGDGTNATGDGIYIHGARDVALYNLTVTAFGRDNISIDSSATVESSGIYIVSSSIANGRRSGIRAVYGTQYVTNVSTVNCHINGYNAPATAIYLDSVTLWMTATYVDIPASAGGHVVMVKSGATFPGIVANSVNFDNATGPTATSLDVSTVFAKNARLSTAIRGNFQFTGVVAYSDGNVQEDTSRGGQLYQPVMLNPSALNSLLLPLDETDMATSVNLSRTGTSGGGAERVVLGASGLKLPGTFAWPLVVNGGSLWTNTNGVLTWDSTSNIPSSDSRGVTLGTFIATQTFSSTGNIAHNLLTGTHFIDTATCTVNCTATWNNPSNCGGASCLGRTFRITWKNVTTGGAVLTFAFAANWKTPTAVPVPALGFNRTYEAFFDGTNYVMTFWSPADVAN